ncbi:uncharacterized protein PSFLO_01401 [Pseudozyma flocculosa]|uniref:Uncharacterized protein n=1 Tax=Pseudozyma flocculosa TaxID=84751 RepID=A0A5C3EVQ2_9BASI|nr:uncharacterized protein PSFLO_01401 [Pseudozyma flocculosa]
MAGMTPARQSEPSPGGIRCCAGLRGKPGWLPDEDLLASSSLRLPLTPGLAWPSLPQSASYLVEPTSDHSNVGLGRWSLHLFCVPAHRSGAAWRWGSSTGDLA